MPFGLHSAPATFQRALDSVIGPDMEPNAFAYLDDIIIIGRTLEEHVQHLQEVFRRLRNANLRLNAMKCSRYIQSGIRATPYYMAFGQHFVSSGSTYKLLKSLGMLEDRPARFKQEDSLELAHSKAREVMQKQNKKNERKYNLRFREVVYQEGQEVYRKNFRQSNFSGGYSAKLGPLYLKDRIQKKLGNSCYELEDLQGRSLGRYHAKDLKQ
ncbi:hypothetical protein KR084_009345 [Drosophila pseudotakahashii]|nr:hypothetical protein KR084_009345 [Drosophila pseudotakahashii]